MLVVLAIMVFVVAVLAAWVGAVVSASRYGCSAFAATGRTRGSTILLVALTGWSGVGSLYYWLVIHRELEPHRDAPPTLPPRYAAPG